MDTPQTHNKMVEFEGTVPLTEDILKKDLRFSPTWAEWSADYNNEQVVRSVSRTSGGTSTFFTVPDKQTLFITSAWISGIGSSAGTIVNFRLHGSAFSSQFLRVFSNDINGTSISQQYANPLRFEAGQVVEFTISIGQGVAGAGFAGFLVSKRLS